MTIALDISMLVYAGSGVSRYTFSLAEALLKYHPEHKYKLFYSSRRRPTDTTKMLNELKALGASLYDYPLPPWLLKIIWNRWHIFPIRYLMGHFDVFHSSDYLRPPLPKNCIAFTTIHDLTWLVLPDRHETSTILSHQRKINKTLELSDIVLVDSQHTKNDLLTITHIEKSNVNVLPLGIDERFRPANSSEIKQILHEYKIKTPYILYVGAIEPRKRVDLCIRTYYQLIQDKEFSHFQFVIAGRAGWKNESVFQLVNELGLSSKVHFIGYVSDADLPALYSGAAASLYLSEYEGFGLPPLESLSCGTPVLASSTSSVTEFVPENFLSTSTEPDILAQKLRILLPSKSKSSLIDLNVFSWKHYSDEFIKIIKQHTIHTNH